MALEPDSFDWCARLIENARDNRGELERLLHYLEHDRVMPAQEVNELISRVNALLPHAAPESPPQDEVDRIFREAGFIEDTTAYDEPRTTSFFFPLRGRRDPDEV